MKVSKKAAVAAASALVALSATSALAMEHLFNGAFTVQYDVSNFNGSRSGQDYYNPYDNGVRPVTDPAYQASEKKAHMANFVESRARLGYTAKANKDLKFVSIFELDYKYWGNSSYTEERNGGGALGADTVNIETKNLYLDANIGSNTNVKLGMQGFDDAFKGVVVSADMAGALLTHSYTNATASFGLFRWDDNSDQSVNSLGRDTRDFVVIDGKYNLNKDTKIGGAYYFMKDNTGSLDEQVHTLGVNFETVAGPLNLNGFIAGQAGEVDTDQKNLTALAASLGANMKAGKGTLRGDLLFATGDDGGTGDKSHAFQSTAYESGYYGNEMVILGRDKNAMTVDNAIVYDANNEDRGVLFLAAGYDLPLTDKMSCSANLGAAWNAKKQNGDEGKYRGTEVNAELTYNVLENVKLGARAAYVFLGSYYDSAASNGTPDDPYDIKLIAKYTF